MRAIGGRAAAYVCRNFSCQRPVTDPKELAAILAEAREQQIRTDGNIGSLQRRTAEMNAL
jgi:hypothetical protein